MDIDSYKELTLNAFLCSRVIEKVRERCHGTRKKMMLLDLHRFYYHESLFFTYESIPVLAVDLFAEVDKNWLYCAFSPFLCLIQQIFTFLVMKMKSLARAKSFTTPMLASY